MIKILEIANFDIDISPVDRNRRIISSFMDKKKFEVSNITGKNKIEAEKKLLLKKFDVIHTRSWPICIPLFIAVKMRNINIKQLYSVHGLPDNKYCYKAGKILSKMADVVHCVSKITADQVKKEYGVDSIVIYNGIDTKKYKPIEHNNKRVKIIYVGSYTQRKKPQYVLELARQFPQYDFLMYGSHFDTALFKIISSEAKNLGNLIVEKQIPREMLIQQIQKSDIFLFPTLHEGFANVLLEATVVGAPVIAFNVSSIPEFIEHGENGLLLDVKFTKGSIDDLQSLKFSEVELDLEDMKKQLQYLAENEDVRRQMSKNARRIAEKFDWRIIAKQYEKTYEQLCS
jgi:glycosyltransferase involved in cell wall biosynthesis